MSEDGSQVFFDSTGSLAPQVVSDGVLNVYEWEAGGAGTCTESVGCTYLVSEGNSAVDSVLIGASSDGSNVFFVTHSQLVPQDTDNVGRYLRCPRRRRFPSLHGIRGLSGRYLPEPVHGTHRTDARHLCLQWRRQRRRQGEAEDKAVWEGQGAPERQMRKEAQSEEGRSSSGQERPRGFQVSPRRHNHVCMAGLAALCCLTFAGLASDRAGAFADSPAWTVSAVARPANFVAGDHSGKDLYEVIVTNTGDAPSDGSTVTIADTLPAGLTPAGEASGNESLPAEPLHCVGLTCTFSGVVAAGGTFVVMVPVDVWFDCVDW